MIYLFVLRLTFGVSSLLIQSVQENVKYLMSNHIKHYKPFFISTTPNPEIKLIYIYLALGMGHWGVYDYSKTVHEMIDDNVNRPQLCCQ